MSETHLAPVRSVAGLNGSRIDPAAGIAANAFGSSFPRVAPLGPASVRRSLGALLVFLVSSCTRDTRTSDRGKGASTQSSRSRHIKAGALDEFVSHRTEAMKSTVYGRPGLQPNDIEINISDCESLQISLHSRHGLKAIRPGVGHGRRLMSVNE
jgi:hypothetical protein